MIIKNVELNNYSGKSIDINVSDEGHFDMYDYKWQIKFRQNGVFALIDEDGEPVERYSDAFDGFTQSFYLLDSSEEENMEDAVRLAVSWIANYV